MRRILFVDDEPNVLEGLKRMLYAQRKVWDMSFAQSADDALDMLANEPADLVVSDLRMPGKDGVALLSDIAALYPQTVRFLLSGQSEKNSLLSSVSVAHQFLSKPCEPKMLKNTVDRAFLLRDLLSDQRVTSLATGSGELPALPQTYKALVDELNSPDASIKSVGQIIERDVAMTAKLLQVVNSAFFGLRSSVSSAAQAASLLGLETVQALVLAVGIFSGKEDCRFPSGFSLDTLWNHSLSVGTKAREAASILELDRIGVDAAFTAGLLHDLGKLLLATNEPEKYASAFEAADGRPWATGGMETNMLGCSHGPLGAYLLGIWGLPDPIVEAVTFHHAPSICSANELGPLAAVHVANAFDWLSHSKEAFSDCLDKKYASSKGLASILSQLVDKAAG